VTALGIRLALVGGRASFVALALTAGAVAIGTAVLLFALSAMPAFEERAARVAWRAFGPDTAYADGANGLLMFPVQDRFRDEQLVVVRVAPVGSGAPVPPGLDRLPAEGEAFVSRALADLLAVTPADELGDRLGSVVGRIGTEAIGSPDELTAVVGVPVAQLEAVGAPLIAAFPTATPELEIPLVGRLIIVIAVIGAMAPVAVFVATATRLSAARREQRLAALRLVGATPAQVARLSVVETLLTTIPGALLGLAVFIAARPLVALVELDGHGWYPETIAPPVFPAIALLLLVPIVGVSAALYTLRRVVVSPLGIQRRARPHDPSAAGLVLLAGSIGLLLASLTLFPGLTSEERVILPAGAFGGVLLGIVTSGPWLTRVLGQALRRGPGAAPLLAGRRLIEDPRGSFGAIAGVIMAVYVASAFFSLFAYAEERSTLGAASMRPGQLVANLIAPTSAAPDIEQRVEAVPGVTGVTAVRGVELHGPLGLIASGWIAPCAELLVTLDVDGARCSAAPVHEMREMDDVPGGRWSVHPDRAPATGPMPPPTEVRLEADSFAPLAPSNPAAASDLVEMIVEPSFLGDRAQQFPVTRLYVSTDGSAGAQERVRTVIATSSPGSEVRTTAERAVDSALFAELGRIVALGVIGSLALAGCSLAVATTTALLERRRQFALLRSAGMSARDLRAIVLLQAATPLLAVAAFSAVVGALTAQLILRVAAGETEVPLPDAALYVTLAASLLAAMLVVALTLPPLERLTRPETVRLE
jgi:hypothetical protein